ncbi:hypothetical protein BGW80DRAFT_1293692, partial [Lactifluus volemus]
RHCDDRSDKSSPEYYPIGHRFVCLYRAAERADGHRFSNDVFGYLFSEDVSVVRLVAQV